jgi:predicted DNA binding CopG/RHH family protein
MKKRISIALDPNLIEDLKKMAAEMGIGYQVLINIVLTKYSKGNIKVVENEEN